MNKKLEEIKFCTTCFSEELKKIPNFAHEDIELNEYYSDTIVMRTDDVVQCTCCDTLYYLDNGKLCKEFSHNPDKNSKKNLNWASDYEVATNKVKV